METTTTQNGLGLSFASKERLNESQNLVIKSNDKFRDFGSAMRSLQCPETLGFTNDRLDWQAPRGMYAKSLREIMDVDEFPENWSIDPKEQEVYLKKFEDALNLIHRSMPDVFDGIESTIFQFFFARRPGYGGGSVSSKIGMIWLAPEESWTTVFWAENIIHEFIHNTLFLEDMVHGVFPYTSIVMSQPQACVLSSIRQQPRGYDKSFHAAFVALGIIRFYLILEEYKKARNFVAPLIKSVEGLIQKEEYLSRNGRRLLRELVESTINLPHEVSMQDIAVA